LEYSAMTIESMTDSSERLLLFSFQTTEWLETKNPC
jgi:hypothetical protein